MAKYEKKKKELAGKGMPDPVVKKNVNEADKRAAMYKFYNIKPPKRHG